MSDFLPLIQLILVAVIVVWNIVLTGRIAQVRTLPRPFVTLTALAGFLLLPALAIHLATTSSITGRAVTAVDWLWPATLVLFGLQALYAASRRLVNPFLGFFMATYNVLVAADAVLRFVAARGTPLPQPALVFLAATTGAFAFATQSSTALGSPWFLFVPMTAPAFPALRPWARTFRLALAVTAAGWIVIILTRIIPADQAINSYALHDPSVEKLQERPDGDFDVGVKIFPRLDGAPAPVSVANDLSLVDSLGVAAVNVVVVPEALDKAALDSLTRSLERLRSDSALIILTMGYAERLLPLPGRSFSEARRLKSIGEIVRRLRPDILLPAEDPYLSGARAAGVRPPQFWQDFLTKAAAESRRARPRTRIGVAASVYDRRDSTLYAWAASPDSPIDVVGFSLYPTTYGLKTMDAEKSAADRWMRESNSTKDHWIFGTGGFPEAHGEASQERAIWASLAWATSRPLIKGVIVTEAGDYGTIRGLRAPDGHLRRAYFAVKRAINGLRESAAPDVAPTLKVPARVGS